MASGFPPLIAAWLEPKSGGTLWLVAGHNVAVAILSLVCAHLLSETRGRDLDEAWVEAPKDREDALVAA